MSSPAWSDELCGAPLAGVVWAERGTDGEHGSTPVVAPEGPNVWRHSAWPVADQLFGLDAPPARAPALVAGGSAEDRAVIDDELRKRNVEARLEERLTLDALRAAAVVVLLGGADAVPALAFAPLAARRILVVPRRARTFGLHDEVDAFTADDAAGLAERANIAVRHPEAFEITRVLGALAAERQRASALNERLAADLRLVDRQPPSG